MKEIKSCACVAKRLVERAKKRMGKRAKVFIFARGTDAASNIYVENKKKMLASLGVRVFVESFDPTKPVDLRDRIKRVSQRAFVKGIIVQCPHGLGSLGERIVLSAIPPAFDLDRVTPYWVAKQAYYASRGGGLTEERAEAFPVTCTGIYRYLVVNGLYNGCRKLATVYGRSRIVGLPTANMLTAMGYSVRVFHSETPNMDYRYYNNVCADQVVILATGNRNILDPVDYSCMEDCTVIDVGINRTDEGKIVGDFDADVAYSEGFFEECRNNSVTPVPGGVGKLTVAEFAYRALTN